MRTRIAFLSAFLLLFAGQMLLAQVSGVVNDASGFPDAGAEVSVKGKDTSTLTDDNGAFTIDAVVGEDVLVILPSDGGTSWEVNVSSANLGAIKNQKSLALTEVVMVGFGIVESDTEKSGSYTSVSSETLNETSVASFDQALQGRVPGLQVGAGSGQPGAFAPVYLRGLTSLTAGTQPLYVINGIPVLSGDNSAIAVSGNPLASINPDDIEDIKVLKDAMATSIYGSRGANGVILVTTKSGKRNSSEFTFSSQIGFGDIAFEDFDWLNAQEQVELVALGRVNSGLSPDLAAGRAFATTFLNWDGSTDTNWREATRRNNALSETYNLNYRGGNENTRLFASLGYFNQEGISREASFTRISGNLDADWDASDRLTLGFNMNLSTADQRGLADASSFRNPVFTGNLLSATNPIFNPDGSYNLNLAYLNPTFNPVAVQDVDVQESDYYKALINIEGTYKIIDDLSIRSQFGVDLNFFDEILWFNPDFADGLNPGDPLGNGNGSKTNNLETIWNWQNVLFYDKKIGKHGVNAAIGMESTYSDRYTTTASAQGYAPGLRLFQLANAANPSAASSTNAEYSFFGTFARGSYTFDNRYSVSGSFRRDGSSRFGANTRYGNFWAVGGTWNVHNEAFLRSSKFVNQLKLRGSYGTVGNASIGNYTARPLFGFGDYLNSPAGVITNPGNQSLTWEVTATTNLGVDFRLLDNRIFGSVDVYEKESEELLLDAPIPGTSGFTTLTRNVGVLQNRGVEVALGFVPFRSKDGRFSWTVNTTFSYNDIELTNLVGDQQQLTGLGGLKEPRVGKNPSEFVTRIWAGVNPADGTPLWFTDETRTATTGVVGNAELVGTGDVGLPPYLASFNSDLRLGDFRFSFLLNFQGGHAVWDRWAFVYDNDGRFANLNHLAAQLYDSWTPTNTDASRPAYQFNSDNNNSSANSTRYIYNADHIRLRNIELGYNLTSKILGEQSLIKNMYLYVRGVNLVTYAFDEDLYFDPEVASNAYGTTFEGAGVFDQTAPNLRQFFFGLNVKF